MLDQSSTDEASGTPFGPISYITGPISQAPFLVWSVTLAGLIRHLPEPCSFYLAEKRVFYLVQRVWVVSGCLLYFPAPVTSTGGHHSDQVNHSFHPFPTRLSELHKGRWANLFWKINCIFDKIHLFKFGRTDLPPGRNRAPKGHNVDHALGRSS